PAVRLAGIVNLLMLWHEAIRLASRQEQSHGLIASGHHAVAATRDRRHADAQVRGQDTESLHSRGTIVGRLPWALARHGDGGGSAALPVALGRSRHFADVAKRRDRRV